jgi:hypothetical protein
MPRHLRQMMRHFDVLLHFLRSKPNENNNRERLMDVSTLMNETKKVIK